MLPGTFTSSPDRAGPCNTVSLRTRRDKQASEGSLPNLFLVGAPKCGTTTVATVIASHPDVGLGATKEPCYLNTDFGPRKISEHAEYIQHFKMPLPRPMYVCDASTTYLYSDAARHFIRGLPHAMVLIMARNPIDMALSWFAQKRFTLEEDVESFEDAWNLIPERRKGESLPGRLKEPRWVLYDEMAALGSVSRKWVDEIGMDRVKVLLLENMQNDPREFFEGVFKFLGLPSQQGAEYQMHLNKRRSPKSFRIAAILASTARLRRQLIPFSFGSNLLSRLYVLNSTIKPAARQIDTRFESELREHFAEEVKLLEELSGSVLMG